MIEDDERVAAYGGDGEVFADLRADGEALAAELKDRFGDAVSSTVGGAPYPPSEIPSDAHVCRLPEIAPWPAGVRATVQLDEDTVPVGTQVSGTVTVVKDPDDRFTMQTGLGEREQAQVGGVLGSPGMAARPYWVVNRRTRVSTSDENSASSD